MTILGLAWIDQQKETKIPEIGRRKWRWGNDHRGSYQTQFKEGGATRR